MDWVDNANASLLTDLYELTMAASYHKRGMNAPATFDLFVRELPERRNFLVSCGLEQALEYLEGFAFDDEAITYLTSLGLFSDDFLDSLSTLSFSGDVWAIPEGELVFEGEPLLSVTAPLVEAQVVETFLINCVAFQTMVASKAARIALACRGKKFVDFSPRRDHGADAALKAARAAYIGGAAATSNVLAGHIYGLPVTGTMAHSYVLAFDDEETAFRSFAEDFPADATLLIDTFDVEQGARKAVAAAHAAGVQLKGVRIDSGDLVGLAGAVRVILDKGGFEGAQIVLSGDLDEYRIDAMLRAGVVADSFGVGTQLGTSGDAPSLGAVYKLVEDTNGPKMKLSTGKATYPGRKQVFRCRERATLSHDVIGLRDENIEGSPLLRRAMRNGRRTAGPESLDAIQERCGARVSELPVHLKDLEPTPRPYEVRLSPGMEGLLEQLRG